MSRPFVLALVGPTGTGKTVLACELARRTGAEVIGADSMQVYRGMDIGTAKPSVELRTEIPHHCIDLVAPDDPMSAGRFAEHARRSARDIHARGRPVVVCGGSGLYLRAFAGGLIAGVSSDPDVRARLECRSTEDLHEELLREDPQAASRIPRRDRVRIVRALEVQQLGRRPISALHDAHGFEDRPFDLRWLCLDLPREILWERLARRVDAMFAQGFVDEVRGLHAAGYGPDLRPLQSIGYREVADLLAGRVSRGEARERILVATRRYAKRQRTWFRSEPGMHWIDATRPEEVLEAAQRLLCNPVGDA